MILDRIGMPVTRDLKKAKKSGMSIKKLIHIIVELQYGDQLPIKNKNHKLKGDYINYWKCHIGLDWLLIYQLTTDELVLVRLGSYSELFQ